MSVSRYISTSFRITKSIFPHTITSCSADVYWDHLQRNGPNIERTLNTIGVKLDPISLITILKRCAINHPLLGVRFFIWAGIQPSYGHPLYMYNYACNLFRIDRNPGIIYELLQAYWREKCWVSVKTFKLVLSLCKEAKLANEGLSVLRKMKEFKCEPNTTSYNIVIRLFCDKGNVDKAEMLRREMRLMGNYPDMITYHAIVNSFVDASRLTDAYGIFKIMKAHGCLPNTVFYSTLLDGVRRFGSYDMTLKLLDEMENGGQRCRPTTVTYTTVIQSLCEVGRLTEAISILDRMKAFGCSPNKITMSILINGLCVEDHVEEAYKLIERVVEEGSLSVGECYSSLVVSLLYVGKFEEAEKVFRLLLAGAVNPDGLASSLLIKGLCLKGRVLDGYRLYNDIKNMGYISSIDLDVYSPLFVGLIRERRLVEAENLAGLMSERGIQLKPPYKEHAVEYLKNSGEDGLLSHFLSLCRFGDLC